MSSYQQPLPLHYHWLPHTRVATQENSNPTSHRYAAFGNAIGNLLNAPFH